MTDCRALRRGRLVALAFVAATACVPRLARAQQPSPSAPQVPAARDTGARAPITPRRAFLYSLAFPGYAQSVLGRHKAAAGLLAFEAIAIAMIRESSANVQEARRGLTDSVVVTYVDGAGNPSVTRRAPRFDAAYVRTRRNQLEDWIAVLVANHLFAGADAYVAANLWDLPTQLSLRASPGRATLAARIAW